MRKNNTPAAIRREIAYRMANTLGARLPSDRRVNTTAAKERPKLLKHFAREL